MRLRLRTFLLSIVVLTILGWHAAKVTIWFLRRPSYQFLEIYHRGEAEGLNYLRNSVKNAHRLAVYCMTDLLINPNLDVHKETARGFGLGLGGFHPFSGPRSGWMDEMETHQAEIDQLAEAVAEHEWLSKWYKRAYATPWCEPPSEEIGPREKSWLEPRVPWWSMMGTAP